MKIKQLLLSVVLALMSSAVSAQPKSEIFKSILGDWQGSGSLFEMEASFTMQWSSELNNKFIKLSFENSFKDKTGTQRTMNAQAYYDLKNKKGYWFDSRGLILPLRLEFEGNSMTVFWGDEWTEEGKTIYTMMENIRIHVEDFVLRDDEYAPFGTADYVRME